MAVSLARVGTLFSIPHYRYRLEEPGLNEKLAAEIANRIGSITMTAASRE